MNKININQIKDLPEYIQESIDQSATNAFSTVKVGDAAIAADSPSSILNIEGSGSTTISVVNDALRINSSSWVGDRNIIYVALGSNIANADGTISRPYNNLYNAVQTIQEGKRYIIEIYGVQSNWVPALNFTVPATIDLVFMPIQTQKLGAEFYNGVVTIAEGVYLRIYNAHFRSTSSVARFYNYGYLELNSCILDNQISFNNEYPSRSKDIVITNCIQTSDTTPSISIDGATLKINNTFLPKGKISNWAFDGNLELYNCEFDNITVQRANCLVEYVKTNTLKVGGTYSDPNVPINIKAKFSSLGIIDASLVEGKATGKKTLTLESSTYTKTQSKLEDVVINIPVDTFDSNMTYDNKVRTKISGTTLNTWLDSIDEKLILDVPGIRHEVVPGTEEYTQIRWKFANDKVTNRTFYIAELKLFEIVGNDIINRSGNITEILSMFKSDVYPNRYWLLISQNGGSEVQLAYIEDNDIIILSDIAPRTNILATPEFIGESLSGEVWFTSSTIASNSTALLQYYNEAEGYVLTSISIAGRHFQIHGNGTLYAQFRPGSGYRGALYIYNKDGSSELVEGYSNNGNVLTSLVKDQLGRIYTSAVSGSSSICIRINEDNTITQLFGGGSYEIESVYISSDNRCFLIDQNGLYEVIGSSNVKLIDQRSLNDIHEINPFTYVLSSYEQIYISDLKTLTPLYYEGTANFRYISYNSIDDNYYIISNAAKLVEGTSKSFWKVNKVIKAQELSLRIKDKWYELKVEEPIKLTLDGDKAILSLDRKEIQVTLLKEDWLLSLDGKWINTTNIEGFTPDVLFVATPSLDTEDIANMAELYGQIDADVNGITVYARNEPTADIILNVIV